MELFHNAISFVSIAYFWFTVIVIVLVGIPVLAGLVYRPIRDNRFVYEVLAGGLLRGYNSCFCSALKAAVGTVLAAMMIGGILYYYHGVAYAVAFIVVELTYYMVCHTVKIYYVS